MTRFRSLQFLLFVTLTLARPVAAQDLLPIGANRLMVTIVESNAPARYDKGAVVAINVVGPSGIPTELNYRAVVLGTHAELVFLELLPIDAMDLVRRREKAPIELRQIATAEPDWLAQRLKQDSEKTRIVLAPNWLTFDVTVALPDEAAMRFWPGTEIAADLDTGEADAAPLSAYFISAEKQQDGRYRVTLVANRFYAAQIITADRNGRLGLARSGAGRRQEGKCYIRTRSGQSVRDVVIPCQE